MARTHKDSASDLRMIMWIQLQPLFACHYKSSSQDRGLPNAALLLGFLLFIQLQICAHEVPTAAHIPCSVTFPALEPHTCNVLCSDYRYMP